MTLGGSAMPATYEAHVGAIALALRGLLEGGYDAGGVFEPGDLARRLEGIGVHRDRAPIPVDDLPELPPEDRTARTIVDAFIASGMAMGLSHSASVDAFLRKAAHGW